MKIANHVLQAEKGINYDQKGSICILEVIGRAKRQSNEDSRMEEMHGKDAVIRHRVFVVGDHL